MWLPCWSGYYYYTTIFAVSTTLYCVLDVESAGSRVGRNVITSHIMLGPGPAWTLELETNLRKVFTIKETASTTYWDLLLHPGWKCLLALSHSGAVHKWRRNFLGSLTPLGAYVSFWPAPWCFKLTMSFVNCPEPVVCLYTNDDHWKLPINHSFAPKGNQLSLLRPIKAFFGWISSNCWIFRHSSAFLMTLDPSRQLLSAFYVTVGCSILQRHLWMAPTCRV